MRILDNWGKKALCFFAFAILCALSAYAESCSTSGQLRYSASGCSYTTEICCHGAWTSGATCTECSSDQCWNGSSCVSKPSTAPYMLNNTTTPTAAQYKSNASVCVFNWKCYNGTGWLSNMGSGLNYCACVGGYSWDSSSQTCKQNAATYTLQTTEETETYPGTAEKWTTSTAALSHCNNTTSPRNKMITGYQSSNSYGTLSAADCASATAYKSMYYNFSSCSTYSYYVGSKRYYGWKFTYKHYECVKK